MLIADGAWAVGHLANVEELDPKRFIELMNRIGLVTRVRDARGDRVLHPQDEAAVTASQPKRTQKVSAHYYAKPERALSERRPFVNQVLASDKHVASNRDLS